MSVVLTQSETIAARAWLGSAGAPAQAPLFSVRAFASSTLADFGPDIASLAERSIARNVFFERDFLIHAARHLRDDGKPQFATVWRNDAKSRLVGLFPVVMPRFSLGVGKARGWLSHYMTDGTPLIDAGCAPETLCHFLTWLEGERSPAGVLFRSIDADGPFAMLLHAVALRDSRAIATFDERPRAILRISGNEVELSDLLRPKKRKELLRQQRRLMHEGALSHRSATGRAEVCDAFEHFLALEVRGWKGRAGTAMVQQPAAAAFARPAIQALADHGGCRIELLELDGVPIAATIEFSAGDRVAFWKTAYDENYGRFSPGVQLALSLSQRHFASPATALVDSCAQANHPMIDRLWPDRMTVVDFFIGSSAERPRAASLAIWRERLRRPIRALAKRLYRTLRPVKAT